MAGQAELAGKLLDRGMLLSDAHGKFALGKLLLEVCQLGAGLRLYLQENAYDRESKRL